MVVVFWVLFASTVAALAATAWAGIRGRRRTHFVCVAITLTLLYATIRMTRSLVENVTFREWDLAFHLNFAITATALIVPVAITGIGYAMRGGRVWRLLHRTAVILFVVAVLVATATGIWAFSRAS